MTRVVVTLGGRPWGGVITESAGDQIKVRADCGDHRWHPAGDVTAPGVAYAQLRVRIAAEDAVAEAHRLAGDRVASNAARTRAMEMVRDLMTLQAAV